MFENHLADLTRAYLQPHRHYHTLNHIVYMFRKAVEFGFDKIVHRPAAQALPPSLVTAIWYHDVVYVPGHSDNESDSVQLLFRHIFGEYDTIPLSYTEDNVLFDEVKDAIMATKDHVPTTMLAEQLIDLDLAILGDTGINYSAYMHNVFREFFPDSPRTIGGRLPPEWIAGRSAWIKNMLAREKIFWTKPGSDLELQARINLEHELKYLNAG